MSTRASSLYYMLDEHPISKFVNPTMYFGISATMEMKQEMYHELSKSQWLVVQTNDSHEILYGHDRTSWEMLRFDTESYDFVKKYFNEVKSIGNFKIFERIGL